MKIEHVALNHRDPAAVSAWYCQHFGLRLVRVGEKHPFAHFLGDESGQVMFEFYSHDAPVPNYHDLHVLSFHLAFLSDQVEADTARLASAGATVVEPAKTTPRGDTFAMLRDPWGVPFQFVRRATQLIGK
jgi:glyoxylase I family protein